MSQTKSVCCICRIKPDDGIWCVRFKGVVKDEIAKRCRDFVDRSCFEEFED